MREDEMETLRLEFNQAVDAVVAKFCEETGFVWVKDGMGRLPRVYLRKGANGLTLVVDLVFERDSHWEGLPLGEMKFSLGWGAFLDDAGVRYSTNLVAFERRPFGEMLEGLGRELATVAKELNTIDVDGVRMHGNRTTVARAPY